MIAACHGGIQQTFACANDHDRGALDPRPGRRHRPSAVYCRCACTCPAQLGAPLWPLRKGSVVWTSAGDMNIS